MAELLGDETRANRDVLRKEGTPVADDLLGRLNAMDFIDSVLGEDYELPDRIGDYEITGVLGRGGMGTVYKAFQETLDREIALKVLAPRFSADVTMRKRFRTEAKATAAMHHQHIVPIYGYGEASGHLFFAMELVRGVSLDKHITVAKRKGDGAMEPEDAARKFAGVADALALAHKRQILHRDVKPGNLLVHDDGTLALADFGLSKFLGEVSAHLTSIGGFLGTLHYAPPEQARGEELGPASDLYSLGVTLFEAVTGKLPVYGQSTESMLHALLHDEPLELRQLLPRAPRDLEAVLTKLLHKDPRDRYQDGEALALDLIRVSEGEPVRIRKQPLTIRAYRRVKRHPVISGAAVSLLVLLVVVGLWFREVLVGEELEREKAGREHLRFASIHVAREPGSPVGPFGVLDVLSGARTPATDAKSEFLSRLDAAAELLPLESRTIQRCRDSYAGASLQGGDPGGLLELLRRGNGVGAVEALTERIESIKADYRPDDLGERIDLYNLYLTRALASLSAAVSKPQQAINDLNLAAFIRSGAVLPRMLQAFLVWEERDGPEQLLDSLQEFLDVGADVRRATGQFLMAFAGVCPPGESHLMRFPMSYRTRKVLSEKAAEMVGAEGLSREEWYYGLEKQLAEFAGSIANNLGNRAAMQQPMQRARELIADSIARTSPLRAWGYTFDLLDDKPAAGSFTDAARLRGAIHYVRVVQKTLPFEDASVVLRNLDGVIGPLLSLIDAPQPEVRLAAVELRARLQSWIADPRAAIDAVDEWLKFQDDNPAAHLCKFCCLVRAAPKTQADFLRALRFGLNAIQSAVNVVRVKARLARRVRHELARTSDPDARNMLQKLVKSFGGESGDGP